MTADTRILGGVSTLVAVVESGSFVRAAEALGVTQSAVSRAVSRLETRLGIRLLHRTTRSVKLTAEGQRFYEEIAPMLSGIRDAVTSATGAAAVVSGRLRVNIDPFVSRLLLAPQIGSFLNRYPELSLELITRDSLGDLIGEGFDVAVRFGDPPTSSLVVRRVLETRILTVAAPRYIERHGRPTKPSELSRHHCIQFRNPGTGQPFEWEFHRGRKIVPVKTSGRLLLTDVGTMLGACIAGAGIAQVMALGIQDLLDGGQLVELFPDWPNEKFPLFALYPSRTLPPAKLRAFLDFVWKVALPQIT
ncbi:MAG: LysR family transcriptional regulator [Terriglobales bacterium]|jgi:DNA-binding transcriptional LysR family regulator